MPVGEQVPNVLDRPVLRRDLTELLAGLRHNLWVQAIFPFNQRLRLGLCAGGGRAG
jgi:hypothetical protein